MDYSSGWRVYMQAEDEYELTEVEVNGVLETFAVSCQTRQFYTYDEATGDIGESIVYPNGGGPVTAVPAEEKELPAETGEICLSEEQQRALQLFKDGRNVFITGPG